jgi:hypothetical protein
MSNFCCPLTIDNGRGVRWGNSEEKLTVWVFFSMFSDTKLYLKNSKIREFSRIIGISFWPDELSHNPGLDNNGI